METNRFSQVGAKVSKNLRAIEGLIKLINFDYDNFMAYYFDFKNGEKDLIEHF